MGILTRFSADSISVRIYVDGYQVSRAERYRSAYKDAQGYQNARP
jgi:hypothetical protein